MSERKEVSAILAKQVRYYRKKRKLSQLELALQTGVDTRQIGRIEQQVNLPSIVLLRRIAKALEVSIDALVYLPKGD